MPELPHAAEYRKYLEPKTLAKISGLDLRARLIVEGLMTGMHSRLGWPIFACRALVELSVLSVGWLLGGTVGIGTVLFAVLIGPLVHVALPLLDSRRPVRTRQSSPTAVASPPAA